MATRHCDRLSFEREFWQQGVQFVAGVDEAGRGPLASIYRTSVRDAVLRVADSARPEG